jgi:hypothetical protein
MSEHYVFGEDKELDDLRTDINFSKIIKKAQQIGNKSLIRRKK